MKSSLVVLTLLVLLGGCSLFDLRGSSGGARATVVLDLQENEEQTLPPFNATLRFVEKTVDTRCPVDVVCASAGEAIVLLAFTPAGRPPTTFTLTWPWVEGQALDEDGNIVRDIQGFRFVLLDLRPYPDSRTPDPRPAVVTLAVKQL